MKGLIPSRFVGKSFAWTFFIMILLLTGPRYWAASAGIPTAVSHSLYQAAAFIPFILHAVTGCNFDRMWVATETRHDSPAKYGLLLIATFLIGAMFAFGTNPYTFK